MGHRLLAYVLNKSEGVVLGEVYLECTYIAAALFFIMALKGFWHPETAKMGNIYGIVGMLTAILVTLLSPYVYGSSMWLFCLVCLIPTVCIVLMAFCISMTSMPQMVGLLNAFGGLAATLEAFALFFSSFESHRLDYLQMQVNGWVSRFQVFQTVFYLMGGIMGIVTFTGSLIACGKLSGWVASQPRAFKHHRYVTALLWGGIVAAGVVTGIFGLRNVPVGVVCLSVMILLAGIYGLLAVLAIGGADMPIVISILNSGSGWAGVFAGLMLSNTLMILAGSFVGASGMILSYVMCKAMNRSLWSVWMGGFGDTGVTPERFEGDVTITYCSNVAEWLLEADTVAIIPGHGMAVAHAQFAVEAFTSLLRNRGCRVLFGIHPVAGRMPGHMNVLLAEADIPYDIVFSMEEINMELDNVDVAIVIGANDTVNPAALTVPGFALAGMPVIEVWRAKKTVVLKRSLNAGYAGVDNPLFGYPNNSMLLGDARSTMEDLVGRIRLATTLKQAESHDSAIRTTAQEKVVSASAVPSSNRETSQADAAKLYFELGVVKEATGTECRVSITPSGVSKLVKTSHIGVLVEFGAGVDSGFNDADYAACGATIKTKQELFEACKVLTKINCFTAEELELLKLPEEQVLICGFMNPGSSDEGVKGVIQKAVELKTTLLSLDVLPRLSAAQKMDVLSSMALLGGNRAVVEALYYYKRPVGQQITAAGKYPQAKVFVIGAGVAGLAAVGEAHRAGAEVRGFDIRLECKEQVESLGGKYLVMEFDEDTRGEGGYAKPMSPEFIQKEMELFKTQAKECDIFITTAAIPGRPAPKLLLKEHVDLMKSGSVIVDLAAASGGNVEVTRCGEVYSYNNRITVVGLIDLSSRMAPQASEMFSTNLHNLIMHMGEGEKFEIKLEDTIIRSVVITHKGEKMYPPPQLAAAKQPAPGRPILKTEGGAGGGSAGVAKERQQLLSILNYRYGGFMRLLDILILFVVGIITGILAAFAPLTFPPLLFILMLGCWVGYMLIWGITPALHTPLMSVSNAISGVVIIGGMLGISTLAYEDFEAVCNVPVTNKPAFLCSGHGLASRVLNYGAIGVASMNVFGGFAVTQRMLFMFKRSS